MISSAGGRRAAESGLNERVHFHPGTPGVQRKQPRAVGRTSTLGEEWLEICSSGSGSTERAGPPDGAKISGLH